MPFVVHQRMQEIQAKTGRMPEAHELGTFRIRGKNITVTEDMLLKWAAAQNSVIPFDNQMTSDADAHRCSTHFVWREMQYDKADSSKTPEALFLSAERGHAMEKLLATLTDEERKVVHAIREGEGSDRKVSLLLGCKDECARLYKKALIEKLAQRASS